MPKGGLSVVIRQQLKTTDTTYETLDITGKSPFR